VNLCKLKSMNESVGGVTGFDFAPSNFGGADVLATYRPADLIVCGYTTFEYFFAFTASFRR
jgi:hypothetical protein